MARGRRGQRKVASGPSYGPDLIANHEFTGLNLEGWTASGITPSRADSTSDPGASSGGDDSWCMKLANATVSTARARTLPSPIEVGKTYHLQARLYAPSSNTGVNAAGIGWSTSTNFDQTKAVYVTIENAWQEVEMTFVATSTTLYIIAAPRAAGQPAVIGDSLYIDSVHLHEVL